MIEFFYDIASPYSYLASKEVDAVGERLRMEVRWRPFLLGAVFKATHNQTPAALEAKRPWLLKDILQWAAHYGVPFHFNMNFPANSLRIQRILTAVEHDDGQDAVRELSHALYDAHWGEATLDVTSEDVFQRVARDAGFDHVALWGKADDPVVKDLLKVTTNEAIERGAFGAPTMFVGDDMYWGNDRLPLLESMYSKAG